MSIWHLVWIVPLSAVVGYALSKFWTAVDLERSLEEGEPFTICGVTLYFNEVRGIEDEDDED